MHSENDLVYFVQKKSVDLVPEVTPESFKVVESINQPVMTALVDFSSSSQSIQRQSKKLVEDTLPQVAKALYMGMVVAYADSSNYNGMLNKIGKTASDLPVVFHFDAIDEPVVYKGKLHHDDLTIWGKEIIMGAQGPPKSIKEIQETFRPGKVNDP